MITTGILLILTGLMNALSAVLPSGTYFSGLSTGLGWIYTNAMGFDWLFPVSELIAMIGIIVAIEFAFFTWYGIRFLIRMFRGA